MPRHHVLPRVLQLLPPALDVGNGDPVQQLRVPGVFHREKEQLGDFVLAPARESPVDLRHVCLAEFVPWQQFEPAIGGRRQQDGVSEAGEALHVALPEPLPPQVE